MVLNFVLKLGDKNNVVFLIKALLPALELLPKEDYQAALPVQEYQYQESCQGNII